MKGLRASQQVARSLLQRTRSTVKPTHTLLASSSWKLPCTAAAARARAYPSLSLRVSRSLSSSTTAASESAAAAKPKVPSDAGSTGNVFLDYLGTIFLSAVGLIVASLVRSYLGTQNRNKIRDALENTAAIDPLELDDLRMANSEMTVAVYRDIVQQLVAQFAARGDTGVTYGEFVTAVRGIMARSKGESFTIELGHLMDRVVLGALHKQGAHSDEPQSLVLWLVVLSLALSSPALERIQVLYEVLQSTDSSSSGGGSDEAVVSLAQARAMVGYLQDTCQLVPDSQVIPVQSRKYPIQQHECANPTSLVQWEGSEQDVLDVDAFAAILRSKAVCAWGECYNVKRHV